MSTPISWTLSIIFKYNLIYHTASKYDNPLEKYPLKKLRIISKINVYKIIDFERF